MNLEDEFAEAYDIYLRDVELFFMCLLKDVPHFGVIRDTLERYSQKSGTQVVISVVGAARSEE